MSYNKDRVRKNPWEYKCFKCNVEFKSMAKGPSCMKCGQVLKGRPSKRRY